MLLQVVGRASVFDGRNVWAAPISLEDAEYLPLFSPHRLPTSFGMVLKPGEMEPSVDQIEDDLPREVLSGGCSDLDCLLGGYTDFTRECHRLIAGECENVGRGWIVHEARVEGSHFPVVEKGYG